MKIIVLVLMLVSLTALLCGCNETPRDTFERNAAGLAKEQDARRGRYLDEAARGEHPMTGSGSMSGLGNH